MPDIAEIEDTKPEVSLVEDARPETSFVDEAKPKIGEVEGGFELQSFTRSIGQGVPMGLLLTLTYLVDETFTTTYNP